jgi:hypothetical protein
MHFNGNAPDGGQKKSGPAWRPPGNPAEPERIVKLLGWNLVFCSPNCFHSLLCSYGAIVMQDIKFCKRQFGAGKSLKAAASVGEASASILSVPGRPVAAKAAPTKAAPTKAAPTRAASTMGGVGGRGFSLDSFCARKTCRG